RVVATVDAIERHLSHEQLLYRYAGSTSEFGTAEGAFLVCKFWLVDLAQIGRLGRAEELFARASRTANDLGLMAEEFDPATGGPPQRLQESHEVGNHLTSRQAGSDVAHTLPCVHGHVARTTLNA